MSIRTVTLLRHGDIDAAGRLVGHTDHPLTRPGWQQMQAAWQALDANEIAALLADTRNLRPSRPGHHMLRPQQGLLALGERGEQRPGLGETGILERIALEDRHAEVVARLDGLLVGRPEPRLGLAKEVAEDRLGDGVVLRRIGGLGPGVQGGQIVRRRWLLRAVP